MVRRSQWGRWGCRPVVDDGCVMSVGVEGDTEEEPISVLDGVELVLNGLMERGGGVIALRDLDGEEVRIALIVGGIETEHGVLFRRGEGEVGARDLDGEDTESDDVFEGTGEAIVEVGGGLEKRVTGSGVDMEDTRAVIIGVHDGVLSVELVGFEMDHGWLY